ncbi:MAG: integrase family protein [Burkholderiaceae bacterium]
MARPSKAQAVDYKKPQKLTAGLLERAACPEGEAFVMVRDVDHPGLRLRVTAAGGKHWQFEARIQGRLFTRSLGAWPAVPIGDAQAAARDLRTSAAKKIDPREIERQQQAELQAEKDRQQAHAEAARAAAVTVGDVWPLYLENGHPKKKDAWKPRYLADLKAMAMPGGEKKKRGQGTTRPGPLFPLMALALGDVTEDALTLWFDREAVAGRHQATRALMMFRGFLRWCSARPEYRKLTDRDAGRAPAIMENLPPATRRTDKLLKEQVAGWWRAVEQLSNRTASAYLRALLLTGARRKEVAALKWVDVDFKWRNVTLADKVDATRTIPLSPYMAHMLATLPRVGPYVFASASKSGHIVDARDSMDKAVREAGVGHLTFHGLRRTFTQTGRGVVPAGIVAQIQGHKSSATAEGYDIRTLDELRPELERIEAHILTLAGVTFDRTAEPGKLALVVG